MKVSIDIERLFEFGEHNSISIKYKHLADFVEFSFFILVKLSRLSSEENNNLELRGHFDWDIFLFIVHDPFALLRSIKPEIKNTHR